jgi:hypothetical protein
MVASTDRVPDTPRKVGAIPQNAGACVLNTRASYGRVGASVRIVGVTEAGIDASVMNVDVTNSDVR